MDELIFAVECPECGEYHSHELPCKPIYKVNFPGGTVCDEYRIRANSHESAALRFCELNDSDSLLVAKGKKDITAEVIGPDGSMKKYNVSGYFRPEYEAEEIEQ